MAKRRQKQPNTTIVDLPGDILLMIINELDDDRDHSSLSLVSKSFRFLTNGCVERLYFNKFLPKSESAFSRVFTRFSSVRQIVIRSSCRIVQALMAISNSGLDIEHLEIKGKFKCPKRYDMIRLSGRLGMIKGLKFGWFSNPSGLQVVEFIHMFSCVEELDLSDCCVWSDKGIELLALNALNLRIINLSWNEDLTDRSLVALSNCVNLEEISLIGCNRITAKGVWTFLRKRKNLKSVHPPIDVLSSTEDADTMAYTISSSCENLSYLSIHGRFITDTFLRVIATSRSLLTSLSISATYIEDMTYSMTGLRSALNALKGLTRLTLRLPFSGLDTQDEEMCQIVRSLPRLEFVTLESQSALYATLFSLIQNCPQLFSINIHSGKTRETHCDMPQSMTKNYSIRSIYIRPKPDASLKTALKSICPAADLD